MNFWALKSPKIPDLYVEYEKVITVFSQDGVYVGLDHIPDTGERVSTSVLVRFNSIFGRIRAMKASEMSS